MSIFNHFQHLTLSQDQEKALKKIEAFLQSSTQVFMLNGYAGSGKTTILKGLIHHLKSIEKNFDLLAPTGRAAKVIRERTGQEAVTVHKGIYSYSELVEVKDRESFFYYFKIRTNTDVTSKIFIIDEASMLSDAKSEGEFYRFGTGHLLSDLITYTRVNAGTANSKIIFVGDPYQLPPVGDNSSKAFDAEYLAEKFNLTSEAVEMREVKRQGGNSGILKAASKIRQSLTAGYFNEFDLRQNGGDMIDLPYAEFLSNWQKTNSTKIIIAYKNKTCLDLNLQIRELKYGDASLPVQPGDIVIMGGNNYRKGVFNGEFAVVNEAASITTIREIRLKGQKPILLKWRSIELVFPDAESSNKVVRGQMLENFLYGDSGLRPEEMQALFVDFIMRNPGLKQHTDEFKEAIINDECFNALLIKYGYAVTCHKAQGGEWDNVFTVWDYAAPSNADFMNEKQLKKGKTNSDFYRWAYTAITRASKQLFTVNPPYFNSYATLSILDSSVVTSLNELAGKTLQNEEIILDDDWMEQLGRFGLKDAPLQLQDHFVRIFYFAKQHKIELTRWEKIHFEVFYSFSRAGQTAGVKTWINKDGIFNDKYQQVSSSNPSNDFYNEVIGLLKAIPAISIKRKAVEAILTGLEFEIEQDAKFPFTGDLFNDLRLLLSPMHVSIDDVEHQQYKERYTFKRNDEYAIIDFEYNSEGFWGRVVPIKNKSNSPTLLIEIIKELHAFKQENYAG